MRLGIRRTIHATLSTLQLPIRHLLLASLQPPTALGPVPLRALAFIEGSASDVEGSSDESYQG